MLKPNQWSLIIIVGLITFGPRVSAVQLAPRHQEPVVLSTEFDAQNKLMIISGRNFGNDAPIVRLADQLMEVRSFSPTQIVVKIPADMRLATYLLTISTAGSASASGTFNAVIFSTAEK